MTRKTATNNRNANATVAAVQQQQAQAANTKVPVVQKAGTTFLGQTKVAQAAKIQVVNAAPVPATKAPNTQKVQQPPTNAAVKQSTPAQPKPAISPAKPVAAAKSVQAKASAPIQKATIPVQKVQLGPAYEVHMMPNLFQESKTWLQGQSDCHVPHRMATKSASTKTMSKQSSFVASVPVPAAAPNNKAATKTMKKMKSGTNFKNAAGMQLILRPRMEMIVYRPLIRQLYEWAVALRMQHERSKRGRSAAKGTAAQKKQQQKERIFQQRNGPMPMANKSTNKPSAPVNAWAKQQRSKAPSNSAPVDWSTNVWEDFYESKHCTLVSPSKPTAFASQGTMKGKPAPKVRVNKKQGPPSLKPTIPPPKEAKSPEIFEFLPASSPSFSYESTDSERSRLTSKPATRIAGQKTGKPSDAWVILVDKPVTTSVQNAKPLSHYAEQRKKPAQPYMQNGFAREMMHPQAEGSQWNSYKATVEPSVQTKQGSASRQQKQNKSHGGSKSVWLNAQNIAIATGVVAMAGVGLSKFLSQ